MELHKGKLIQLLKAVQEDELKSLVKFVKSPYHNTNKQLVPLLQELLSFYPNFDQKRLTKEYVYRKIHSIDKPYHEGRMNLLITSLVSVVQDFFVQQEFKRNKQLRRQLRGQAFNNRNFYKNYKKEVFGFLDKIDKTSASSENYFYQKYYTNQAFFFHNETLVNQEGAVFLFNAIQNLDLFYITAKLSLAAEQFTLNKKVDTKYEIQLLDEVMEHVEKSNIDFPNIIRFNYFIIYLRKHGHDKKIYENLKKSFFTNLSELALFNQKLIFFNLINHCIYVLNIEKLNFKKELLELYQFGLEKNYLINNGIIAFSIYFNIATTSAQIEKSDWFLHFINKYEKYLQKNLAQQAKLLTLANCYFYKEGKNKEKDFHLTMKYSSEIKYSKKNSFYFFRSSFLWIRSCYELTKLDPSYWPTLSNYIKNVEIQLKRDTVISKEVITRYLNSLKFIKRLVNISKNKHRNPKVISSLLQDIHITSVLFSRWIEKKIGEL